MSPVCTNTPSEEVSNIMESILRDGTHVGIRTQNGVLEMIQVTTKQNYMKHVIIYGIRKMERLWVLLVLVSLQKFYKRWKKVLSQYDEQKKYIVYNQVCE
jgi:hypothetical protein